MMELEYGRKVLKSRIKPNTMHWEWYLVGGGELPAALQGLFTSETEAVRTAEKVIIDTKINTRNGRASKATQ